MHLYQIWSGLARDLRTSHSVNMYRACSLIPKGQKTKKRAAMLVYQTIGYFNN